MTDQTAAFRRGALAAVAVTAALVTPLVGPSGQAGAATTRTAVPAASGHARTAAETKMAAAFLKQLNQHRAAHHLPALRMNSRLLVSARAHDVRMVKAQQLSHQLPGEAVFSRRISAAGYSWRAVAENIGVVSPATTAGTLAVEKAMYNEKAPNDPHRKNMLSRSYVDVGIDVYIDSAHHRAWMTQDFGHRS